MLTIVSPMKIAGDKVDPNIENNVEKPFKSFINDFLSIGVRQVFFLIFFIILLVGTQFIEAYAASSATAVTINGDLPSIESFSARVMLFASNQGEGIQKNLLGKIAQNQQDYLSLVARLYSPLPAQNKELAAKNFILAKSKCLADKAATTLKTDFTSSPLNQALLNFNYCGLTPTGQVFGFFPIESQYWLELIRLPKVNVGDFGRDFLRAFEFIGLEDIAVMLSSAGVSKEEIIATPALSEKNFVPRSSNQWMNEPWTRYDDDPKLSPLLTRWSRATDPSSKNASIVDIYRILSEDINGKYRISRVMGGGDTLVNGIKYYRVTLKQKAALDQSPYLVMDYAPDTFRTDGNTILARHIYPDAWTFKKFESKLSAGLRAKLHQATDSAINNSSFDPFRADTNSVFFKELTHLIIAELNEDALKGAESPAKIYQKLISIHSFTDFNGRSLRVWYKNKTGNPLFLRNFDIDLFSFPGEFEAEVKVGLSLYFKIMAAVQREARIHPNFQYYYTLPEIWQTIYGAETNQLSKPNVVELIRYFQSRAALENVRQKQDLEVTQGMRNIF